VVTARLKAHWPFLALLVALTAYQIWGLKFIPFHPDESTQLYMSADFDQVVLCQVNDFFGRKSSMTQTHQLLSSRPK